MMNKSKYLFVIIVILCTSIATTQEVNFDLDNLLGKWDSYKVTTLEGGDGSKITFDGKPFDMKMMMDFIDSKEMILSINGSENYKMEYLIKDDIIAIMHRNYKIKALEKDKLVLEEEKLLGRLIYLRKR